RVLDRCRILCGDVAALDIRLKRLDASIRMDDDHFRNSIAVEINCQRLTTGLSRALNAESLAHRLEGARTIVLKKFVGRVVVCQKKIEVAIEIGVEHDSTVAF